MKYTIITPTINRGSLSKTVETVDKQFHPEWEHILVFDGPETDPEFVELKRKHEKTEGLGIRKVIATGQKYNDFGHSPRMFAWDFATGDYITYIDDDDYYKLAFLEMIDTAMGRLETSQRLPDFFFFMADRMGENWLNIPPGHERTVSCQYLHRRIDKDGNPIRFTPGGYGHDGAWLDEMLSKYTYAWMSSDPLVVVTQVGNGQK